MSSPPGLPHATGRPPEDCLVADADGDQRSLADPLDEETVEEPAEEFELVDRRSGKQRSTEWFKAMIGNFIGRSPSPMCGAFRCCMVNTGGGVVPYDARGHPTKSRRLEIACKLVADGHMDFVVMPKCHIGTVTWHLAKASSMDTRASLRPYWSRIKSRHRACGLVS